MVGPSVGTPDPSTVYGVFSTLGALGAGALYWFERRKTRNAADQAQIAQHGAARAESEAEAGIYVRLLQRVTALEADVLRLNQEIDAERRLRRQVENHVAQLEAVMRRAGIEPPPFPASGN